jgi:myo-inositol-1(or 4)-monophosphatase
MDMCRGIYARIKEYLPDILTLRNTGYLKEDNSFVSQGDLLCEKLVREYLENNLQDYIVISEESSNDLSQINEIEYAITVDPIDGSENFVSGLKEWGIGISVYKHLKHYQSLIALPEMDICLCTGDKIEKINHSRICGLSSYMTIKDFDLLDSGFEFRIMGCCMYNMYNVIKGSYCQFQHLKGCYSWDILPGMNLALEHGLTPVIDGVEYDGRFLEPNIKYRFVLKYSENYNGEI